MSTAPNLPQAVERIPRRCATVTPYLYVKGAAEAIEFYKNAFGAAELFRMPWGDKIGHAEIRIRDMILMLADEAPEHNVLGPKSRGATSAGYLIYFDDVDAATERAVGAGAKVVRPPADQFYGDRMATIEDPFGHSWTLGSHVEDVSEEELNRRMAQQKK